MKQTDPAANGVGLALLYFSVLKKQSVTFERYGSGPLLVLLHSLIAGPSSFSEVIPALSEKFEVMATTLPGFGGTELLGECGLEATADAVAAAIQEVAGQEKPVLLGNGYGGFVALQMVIRHPDSFSRLIMVDAGACFSEPGRESFRRMARAVAANGLESVADAAMSRLFASEFISANPELVRGCRSRFVAMNPKTFVEACDALSRLDLRPFLQNVRMPVLVLAGERDQATPVEMSRELAAALPQAQLAILAGCAHLPQLQSPPQFLKIVCPFLMQS